jgi:hypothetical protein
MEVTMERLLRVTLVIAVTASLPACYHATIETELTPSLMKIEQPFASSWVYGLVPPKYVETAEECPNGVARVDTQLSFVNGLVGILTLGIYTPMNIEVTCAAGGSASDDVEASVELGAEMSPGAKQKAMTEAAQLSKRTGAPVYIVLRK